MGRRVRRDAGLVRLGPRDLWALRITSEQYALRLSLLAEVLAVFDRTPVSADAARKVASRWHRARIAEVAPILAGQGSHVSLTPYGLRQVGHDYKPWVPSAVSLPHLDAVAAVRISLGALEEHHWVAERTLRQGLHRQSGSSMPHLPDAELLTTGGRVAIEVELTPKTVERTRKILLGLTTRKAGFGPDELADRQGYRYAQVQYFTELLALPVVERAREQLPDELAQRVRIDLLDNLPWPR
jgi:hypothetical protein